MGGGHLGCVTLLNSVALQQVCNCCLRAWRLCTDNGAMIASFAAHLLAAGAPPSALTAASDPGLPVLRGRWSRNRPGRRAAGPGRRSGSRCVDFALGESAGGALR